MNRNATYKLALSTTALLLCLSAPIWWSCGGNKEAQEAAKQVQPATEYTCAMHPQIRQPEPGTCPICGMELIPVESETKSTETTATEYTCAMHPQIRQPEPGTCPICGMELIPVEPTETNGEGGIQAHQLSPEALALAEIVTDTVRWMQPSHTIEMLGRVAPDERLIHHVTARVAGRLERLFITYEGQEVQKGQLMAYIYSPELISAQQELLEARHLKHTSPELYEAVRRRLLLWSLTPAEIDSIERTGKVMYYFPVVSPASGVVLRMRVKEGHYAREGEMLFDVAELRQNIWVEFEAYEQDLPYLRNGQRVTFWVEGAPHRHWQGRITYIDPFVEEQRRIVRVRVELPNADLSLKPGMFVRGHIEVRTGQRVLVVPRTAILWTGKRSIVWVRLPGETPRFVMREVELGGRLGDYYIIASGLHEGELVATYGTFRIDASAQLMGMPSMMGGGSENTGHGHGMHAGH